MCPLIFVCDLLAIALMLFQNQVLFWLENHKLCKNKKEQMSNSSSAILSKSNLLCKFRYIACLIQIKPIWAFIWWTAPNTYQIQFILGCIIVIKNISTRYNTAYPSYKWVKLIFYDLSALIQRYCWRKYSRRICRVDNLMSLML